MRRDRQVVGSSPHLSASQRLASTGGLHERYQIPFLRSSLKGYLIPDLDIVELYGRAPTCGSATTRSYTFTYSRAERSQEKSWRMPLVIIRRQSA